EIEIAVVAGNRLMPPPEQEAGHGEPLEQVLALEPFLELGLAAGAAVIEDRQDALLSSHGHAPARSTLALRAGTPNSLRQTSASTAIPSRISSCVGLAKHSL